MIHPAVVLGFHWTEILKCPGNDTNKSMKCAPKLLTCALHKLGKKYQLIKVVTTKKATQSDISEVKMSQNESSGVHITTQER